jgi:hypothetical protein
MGNINFLLIHFWNTTFLAFVVKILKVLLITNFITVSTEHALGHNWVPFCFSRECKITKTIRERTGRWGDSKIYIVFIVLSERIESQRSKNLSQWS